MEDYTPTSRSVRLIMSYTYLPRKIRKKPGFWRNAQLSKYRYSLTAFIILLICFHGASKPCEFWQKIANLVTDRSISKHRQLSQVQKTNMTWQFCVTITQLIFHSISDHINSMLFTVNIDINLLTQSLQVILRV